MSKLWDSPPAKPGLAGLIATVQQMLKVKRYREQLDRMSNRYAVSLSHSPEEETSEAAAAVEFMLMLSCRSQGFNPTFHEITEGERYGRVTRALRILNPVDAEVVRRYFGFGYDPMSDSQIAKEMGVSRTMVYFRLQRAKRVLAPLLTSFAPRAAA